MRGKEVKKFRGWEGSLNGLNGRIGPMVSMVGWSEWPDGPNGLLGHYGLVFHCPLTTAHFLRPSFRESERSERKRNPSNANPNINPAFHALSPAPPHPCFFSTAHKKGRGIRPIPSGPALYTNYLQFTVHYPLATT